MLNISTREHLLCTFSLLKINFKLFEDTKFSLLKVYCNLRNLKLQLRGRQDG